MPVDSTDDQAQKFCFVIGPISEVGTEQRKHADFVLETIIRPVFKDRELKYRVKRADKSDDPTSIPTEIIQDLLSADLVIADFSFHNPNVFYELGIRHTAAKPTIHMIRDGDSLPFDNQDYRAIRFVIDDIHRINEASSTLDNQVSATERDGYAVINPVTIAAGRANISSSASDLEILLLNNMNRVDELSSNVSTLTSDVQNMKNAYLVQPGGKTYDRGIGPGGYLRFQDVTGSFKSSRPIGPATGGGDILGIGEPDELKALVLAAAKAIDTESGKAPEDDNTENSD